MTPKIAIKNISMLNSYLQYSKANTAVSWWCHGHLDDPTMDGSKHFSSPHGTKKDGPKNVYSFQTCVCVYVCTCVRVRKGVWMCVCVYVCVYVYVCVRVCACVSETKNVCTRKRMCVRERERECMCEGEKENVCAREIVPLVDVIQIMVAAFPD